MVELEISFYIKLLIIVFIVYLFYLIVVAIKRWVNDIQEKMADDIERRQRTQWWKKGKR